MIVFDLDGTLRNNIGSDILIPEDPTKAINWLPWQDFANKFGVPIQKIVDLYHYIYESETVIILTNSQHGTLDWLDKHGINIPDSIQEREPDDNRSPFEFKRDFIDKNFGEIKLWVDDCKRVLDYVESKGVPVVRCSL